MSERQQYGEETKAAVLAALMAGQSVGEVSREYDIPEGTIKSWRSRNQVSQMRRDAMADAADATPKKEIGELLLDYLRTNLETLKAQAEVFADKEWLTKQDASSLAVLHGVMTDKAVRLLEALSKTSGSE